MFSPPRLTLDGDRNVAIDRSSHTMHALIESVLHANANVCMRDIIMMIMLYHCFCGRDAAAEHIVVAEGVTTPDEMEREVFC
jgi:hypothetical protein